MKKLLILACLLLAACGQAPVSTRNHTYDRLGRAIEIPKQAETIISLAPSITQVLTDLGAAPKLIAVDSWSDGFPELPKLDMMTPDLELILSLSPDLVLATEISFGMDEGIFQMLMDSGIVVAHIPTSTSIQGIMDDNQFIADAVGLTEAGMELNREMATAIEEVRMLAKQVETPKTVLFEISPLPDIYSFGQGTFLQEILEVVDAQNVFAAQQGWLPIAEEAAILANPDVILTNVDFLDDPVAEILTRNGWVHVNAIQNSAVFQITNETTSLPNHRIVHGLREIAKAIYPEIFASLGD